MTDIKDKISLLEQELINTQAVVDEWLHFKRRLTSLKQEVTDLDEDKANLTKDVEALRLEIYTSRQEHDTYIARAEEIKNIDTHSKTRLAQIEQLHKESFEAMERAEKENKAVEIMLIENREKVEIIELNSNPMHFYVRRLQELFDKKGIKINVLEELKSFGDHRTKS